MPLSEAAESMATTADLNDTAMRAMFWIGFIVQYLFGALALWYMSINLRSLQFVMHLPLLQLKMPPVVMLLINALLPIVSWDVMDGTIEWNEVIEFSENRVPLEFRG